MDITKREFNKHIRTEGTSLYELDLYNGYHVKLIKKPSMYSNSNHLWDVSFYREFISSKGKCILKPAEKQALEIYKLNRTAYNFKLFNETKAYSQENLKDSELYTIINEFIKYGDSELLEENMALNNNDFFDVPIKQKTIQGMREIGEWARWTDSLYHR